MHADVRMWMVTFSAKKKKRKKRHEQMQRICEEAAHAHTSVPIRNVKLSWSLEVTRRPVQVWPGQLIFFRRACITSPAVLSNHATPCFGTLICMQ